MACHTLSFRSLQVPWFKSFHIEASFLWEKHLSQHGICPISVRVGPPASPGTWAVSLWPHSFYLYKDTLLKHQATPQEG